SPARRARRYECDGACMARMGLSRGLSVVSWPAADFPSLGGNYTVTSPAARRYNCIAWGAANDARWWWPDARNIGYWPPNIPREETLDAFERAYALQGYATCSPESKRSRYTACALVRTWSPRMPRGSLKMAGGPANSASAKT